MQKGLNRQPVAPEVDYQGEPNVTPEEQEVYDMVVGNALQIIYEPKTTDNIIKRIAESGNPVEGLANVVFMVVSTLEKSAQQANQQIPEDVMFHAGVEILEELADLVTREGAHEFTDEEIEAAMFMALDLYGQEKDQSGQIDKEAAKGELTQLEQADKDGTITELVPQFGEVVNGGRNG